ncbi:MAG: GNAT family N-acetyltransferase [Balneolaceae bacterium]|nr:GNAT family N-acetyltransferase [Balneolaceae bacterium]
MLIETRILSITELTLRDISFIRALTNSPGWLEFIGDRNIHSDQDAIKYLETGPMSSYKIHGFGLFRVALKETNEPIGMCGFLKRDMLPYPDLGFAFLPEYQGQGYAYEAASVILNWAERNLTSNYVLALTKSENERSIKHIQKLGFEEISPIPMNNELLSQFQYRLDQAKT